MSRSFARSIKSGRRTRPTNYPKDGNKMFKKVRLGIALTGLIAISAIFSVAPARASLTTAQAQTEFNKAVVADANQGWTWRDCGSIAPLLNKASAGGWWARGDFIYRGRFNCGLNTQVCSWYGYLSPSGYWLDRSKYNCR